MWSESRNKPAPSKLFMVAIVLSHEPVVRRSFCIFSASETENQAKIKIIKNKADFVILF
jgi:hypothetical protein